MQVPQLLCRVRARELTESLQKRGGPQPDLQVRCVAWGCHLNPPTEPVAIVAAKNLIYIIDLGNRRLIGCIRGHGGVCLCYPVARSRNSADIGGYTGYHFNRR